jgi:hypothetical protein
MVQSQSGQRVHETLSSKTQKSGFWFGSWLRLFFKSPLLQKKKKKKKQSLKVF